MIAYHGIIDWYGYEAWKGKEKLYWYDSQPHHKHIPPDIKHHRIPAAEMSFIRPNLAALIREIDTVIKKVNNDTEQN